MLVGGFKSYDVPVKERFSIMKKGNKKIKLL